MAEDLITLPDPPVFVTHDETAGLQNSVVTPNVPGDANDDDVAVSTLPSAFSTRLTNLGFNPTNAIGAAESDGNVILINGTGVSGLKFTDANGDPLDGDSSGLFTTEGAEIFLYTDPVNNNIVLGKTAGTDGIVGNTDDAIAFAVYLEETGSPLSGAKLWTVQYVSLSHNDPTKPDDPDQVDLTNKVFVTADQALSFNFDQLASGASLFGVVGTTANALVVIGEDIALDANGKYIKNQTDDIKTSQGGDGATIGIDSQHFDPGDGGYFTYVTNTSVIGVGDNANSIHYGGTLEVSTAAFRVSQMQSNDLATAQISAYNLDDAPQGVDFINARGLGDPDNDPVSITAVRVFNAAGTLIEAETDGSAPTPNASTVDIVFSGPSGARIATVSGLDDFYTVEWDTSAVHDQVLIEGVNGGTGLAAPFDIGRFVISQPQPAPDEKLDFTVQIADFDGDTASASFSIGIDGTGINDNDQVAGVIINP